MQPIFTSLDGAEEQEPTARSLIGCGKNSISAFTHWETAERDKQSGNKLFIKQEMGG